MIVPDPFVSQNIVKMSGNNLAIIAGDDKLPILVAEAAVARKVVVISMVFSDNQYAIMSKYGPCYKLSLGEVGKCLSLFRQHNVSNVVMAGRIKRPPLHKIKVDFEGTKLLSKLLVGTDKGDDKILRLVAGFFEQEGFRVISAQAILDDLLLKEVGVLGDVPVDEKCVRDIELGTKVAQVVGEMDIGQAVVVQDGVVLGVEGIEGTDAFIDRISALKFGNERGGVLVKIAKPQQDNRLDLPTIGVETIRKVLTANLAGVVLQSGRCLILDKKQVIENADKANVFVLSWEAIQSS
jgi:DUF1009 family protein